MDSISLNLFKESLRDWVEKITHQHRPIKVTDHQGQDFVVVSAEDWEREQETLYILQNQDLMQQISRSMAFKDPNEGNQQGKRNKASVDDGCREWYSEGRGALLSFSEELAAG
ncbi:MAG: type II toxin-antitoxin system Phd/YefM family antitoxin [Symploca sp. SIO2B6]|nr:type II toxin-antitoxin system Phd/YefM family antitoxin [Symploca sp. SIO2B6]